MKLQGYIDKFIIVLEEYTPKALAALIVLMVGLWLIKRISFIANKAFQKRDLDISLRTFLRSLISIGLKVVLIVTVAGMMGIGTASFVTILGAAGLAVGLALQGSLSNFAGGVLLLIFKPYKVGDVIEAQGQTGEVKEIQIFNTIVLTADHKTVIFPNGALSNGTIVNHTKSGHLRADIQISVSLENDIDMVKEIINEIANKHELVLKVPAPFIVIGKIADGAVVFHIRPYCSYDNMGIVVSDINQSLKTIFEERKIKFALPYIVIRNLDSK